MTGGRRPAIWRQHLEYAESDGCEFDHGEEVGGELFVAGGDAAELLEFVETAFDPVSQSIQRLGEGMGVLRAPFDGDDRHGVAVLDTGLVGQLEVGRG